MSGTSEGGKKAAETCGHEEVSEMGRKGGESSHSSSDKQSGSHQKDETMNEKGQKGGELSHGRQSSHSTNK